jgi:hypothetical protein
MRKHCIEDADFHRQAVSSRKVAAVMTTADRAAVDGVAMAAAPKALTSTSP